MEVLVVASIRMAQDLMIPLFFESYPALNPISGLLGPTKLNLFSQIPQLVYDDLLSKRCLDPPLILLVPLKVIPYFLASEVRCLLRAHPLPMKKV